MKSNRFHITIGSCPSPQETSMGLATTMLHDIDLVKSAILYGDEATLCSPVSNALDMIYQSSKVMSTGNFDQRIRALTEMSKVVTIPSKQIDILNNLAGIATKKHPSTRDIILKKLMDKQIDKFWHEYEASGFGLEEGSVIKQFLSAAKVGYLTFQTFEAATPMSSPTAVFTQFTDIIRAAITSDSTYPLLDIQTGYLVSREIMQGNLVVTQTANDRAKQVGLMASLFETLPQFELASLEEILDIRRDLGAYLARFRSAMIKFSESINGATWDSTFSTDSERVFLRDVAPALQDIEDQTRSNTYLSKLTNRYAQHPSTFAVPILSLAVTQMTTFPEFLALLFGVSSIGANVVDVINEWKTARTIIAQNQLFFYYKAAQRLK